MNVKGNNNVYSSNSYLIMGDWKRIEDVNTLIDVGNDPSILNALQKIPAGVGKNKVDQVVLTHNHSDHTGILAMIRKVFNPRVCAFSPFFEGVDHILKDGEILLCGDSTLEVIHTPGHTEDSISLYNEKEGILFVGDSPIIIRSEGGTYDEDFIKTLKRLCRKNIQAIYFGHGEPILDGAYHLLKESLKNVETSVKPGSLTDSN